MQRFTPATMLAFFMMAGFCGCTHDSTLARQDQAPPPLSKPEVTIVITDSGLGGLSVAADVAERMRIAGPFQKVDLVFFNALFSNNSGYNGLPDRNTKIRIFNSALESMERRLSPDLIIIACNTLSVLFDSTPFARRSSVPVKGIVKTGVDLIAENLKARPDTKVILLGTQTTIEEDAHRARLIERGFLPERILPQACPDLVPYIERGHNSSETEMLIFAYVDEALQKYSNGRHSLFVSFNCTHYGYALDLWKKAFAEFDVRPLAYLNPNSRLADFLFKGKNRTRYSNPEISMRALSMVEISEAQILSIGGWLDKISPKTAAALRAYRLTPDLFEWKSLVDGP